MEVKFSKELMKKYRNEVIGRKNAWNLLSTVWYKLDWRNSKIVDLQRWFCECLEEIGEGSEFCKKVDFFKGIKDVDKRMTAILRYVHRILKYTSDADVWNVSEKWQSPTETLKRKTGDCEDGALLIGTLCHFSEIPPEQWSIVCGEVKGGGHCWVNYISDKNALTYHMDWCYWYTGVNIPERKPFFKDKNYKKIWFGFNSFKSWKLIRNPNKKF